MKILHRYILVSLIINLVLTLCIFTFILFLGNIVKDAIVLLSNQSVSLFTISKFFLLLLPSILTLSLPIALLASTLLVMGRLSADHELVASRASGISLFQLILPILGFATILGFFSFYINGFVGPATKYRFNQAFIEIILKDPMAFLPEGEQIKDFEDLVVFIGKRDLDQKRLFDIQVMRFVSDEMTEWISAEEGEVTSDRKQLKLRIKLIQARIDKRDQNDLPDQQIVAPEYTVDLELSELIDPRRAVKDNRHLTFSELWNGIKEYQKEHPNEHPTPMLVELHRRFVFSVACIAFVLIGLPLGIQVQRRETSIGILLSLVLAVLWYLLIIVAECFKKNPAYYPELLLWIPNLTLEAIGIYLLWKQSKV